MTNNKRGVITGLIVISVLAFFLFFVDVGHSKQLNDDSRLPLILIQVQIRIKIDLMTLFRVCEKK